jgi:RNA polymerase sigma-70 factor (ECF subfamily)
MPHPTIDKEPTTLLYEECYHAHFNQVVYYANSYLKDREAAKDIGYEVFLTVWEKRQQIDFTVSMLPFLLVLTRNMCLNRLKAAKTRQKYMKMAENNYRESIINYTSLFMSAQTNLYSDEIQTLLNEALEEMPEQIQRTFYMSRDMGMKYSDIAELDNVSVKAIEKRMMTALRILRVKFKDYLIK